jgi:D-sedoheptulose 7-phosphate isomerase
MINAVFFDIDGILTDGNVYIDSEGKETKRISFDDIDAIFELKRNGIKIGFITGEGNSFSEYVQKRFSPDYFVSGCKDKLGYYQELSKKEKIKKESSCYVGDSQKDIPLLEYLDYTFAPADVNNPVKSSAKFVTKAGRGHGVIKEVADFILSVNNKKVFTDFWKGIIFEHLCAINLLRADEDSLENIQKSAESIVRAYKSGGKLLICGNGGSAADSQHLVAELVSRFFLERNALDAEALTVNTSSLTAIGNDYRYDMAFSRQVEAKGKPDDVLMGISTSGNSQNVINAMDTAKKIGMTTIGLTGENRESRIAKKSQICIHVPSESIPRIQEAHILIGHMICEYIEKTLFKTKP